MAAITGMATTGRAITGTAIVKPAKRLRIS
jgi:hypothetical protein